MDDPPGVIGNQQLLEVVEGNFVENPLEVDTKAELWLVHPNQKLGPLSPKLCPNGLRARVSAIVQSPSRLLGYGRGVRSHPLQLKAAPGMGQAQIRLSLVEVASKLQIGRKVLHRASGVFEYRLNPLGRGFQKPRVPGFNLTQPPQEDHDVDDRGRHND